MNKSKTISTFFSFTLLLIFVVCAFYLLIMQIGGYKEVVLQNEDYYQSHTPISYISNKCRSAKYIDVNQDVLVLTNNGYDTYIYTLYGQLMELNVVSGMDIDYKAGDALFDCDEFHVSKQDHTIQVQLLIHGKHKELYFTERVSDHA